MVVDCDFSTDCLELGKNLWSTCLAGFGPSEPGKQKRAAWTPDRIREDSPHPFITLRHGDSSCSSISVGFLCGGCCSCPCWDSWWKPSYIPVVAGNLSIFTSFPVLAFGRIMICLLSIAPGLWHPAFWWCPFLSSVLLRILKLSPPLTSEEDKINSFMSLCKRRALSQRAVGLEEELASTLESRTYLLVMCPWIVCRNS